MYHKFCNVNIKYCNVSTEFCCRSALMFSTNNLSSVGKLIESTTQRIYLSNLALADLRNKANLLKQTAMSLKDNATRLQESNVEGNELTKSLILWVRKTFIIFITLSIYIM